MLNRRGRWMLVALLLGGASLCLIGWPMAPVVYAAPGIGVDPVAKPHPGGPEYIPGKYIVTFNNAITQPGAETARLAQRFAARGMSVGHVYTGGGGGFSAFIPDSALAAVKADPAVRFIERDQIARATGVISRRTGQFYPPPGPVGDLIITNLKATPTSAKIDEEILVEVEVQNVGQGNVTAFTVSIYKNLNSVPTPFTYRDASKSFQSLAPFAKVTATFTIKYSAAGTYNLRALANSTMFARETNYNNNAAGPVKITITEGEPPPPAPDLIVSELTANPTSVNINDTVNVTVTVKNQGNADAGAFDVTIYPNLASVPDTSTPKGSGDTKSVSGLTAGSSTQVMFTTSYSTAGTKSLRALTDSNGGVGEGDENNNAGGPVSITVTDPSAKADLLITAFSASPTSVPVNQTVTATITVKNEGNAAAGPFSVTIYPDLATKPTPSTPKGPSKTVNGLSPGESATVQLTTSYATAGTKSLRTLCDSYGEVSELSEDNNDKGPISITVTNPPPSSQELPTGIRRIGADQSSTKAGDGGGDVNAVIAIIDTGIDLDHPDLNVIFNKGFGYASGEDDNGHGTHVAGTAAARDNTIGVVGVAPGAKLWALKVLDAYGSGYYSDVIAAVNFCKDNAYNPTTNPNGVMVANMSLGGGFSSSMNSAVNNCVAAGVVVCVAAGNSSANAANTSPASAASAITVAALADSDGKPGGLGGSTFYGNDDTFASFSNYGTIVDVIAPGVSIKSTLMGGGYGWSSGTSMSSPHAAGLFGLAKSANLNATPDQLRTNVLNAVTENIPGIYDSRNYPLLNAKAF